MVIGHIVGSAFNIAAKVIPKGSKIEVAKAVKMAQGISGHGLSPDDVAVGSRGPIEPKGTGSRGGTTKNDKTIDKKLNEKKKKVKKINKSDKKRVLQGKLPVVPRKTHYKKQSKDTPLVVKGSGVKATELKRDPNKWTEKDFKIAHEFLDKERQPGFDYSDSGINLGPKTNITSERTTVFGTELGESAGRPIGSLAKVVDFSEEYTNSIGYPHGIKTSDSDEAFHQRKLMTGIIENQAVERKLAAESRVASFKPGTTAFGEVGGEDPLKDAFLKLQNSPYSPFEQKQITKQYITGKRHGVTFWKKNQFGSTLRNKIEPPKSNSYWRSSDYGGKIGEQSIEEKTAEKLAGLGLGLGGAGIFGAFSYKKKKGSKNDRWGYW